MLKTREEIEKYMERFGGMDDWTINERGEVDVPGSIKLQRSFFPDGRFPFQFGKVDGSFNCSNASLKSLIGSPLSVKGYYDCTGNKLESLEGAPNTVDSFFDCSNNNLTTLEGSPHFVGYSFCCTNNKLTTLEGAPQIVDGGFYAFCNPLQTIGIINTQLSIDTEAILSPLPEFSSVADIDNHGDYHVSAQDFNSKVLELKRIREEKALFESSIVKVLDTTPLGEPTKQAAEPQPQQRAKPKFKL